MAEHHHQWSMYKDQKLTGDSPDGERILASGHSDDKINGDYKARDVYDILSKKTFIKNRHERRKEACLKRKKK